MIVDRHAIATVFTLLTVAGCATSTAARVPDTNARETMMRKEFPALFRSADSALTGMPPTVMQKHKIPPSGNRHDYMSLAPYWWPDSSKGNGLPYVRHDGLVNPDSRIDHDGTRFQAMVDAVEALALAERISLDRKYSSRAAQFLRVWFLDTATRMNPNLNYAQAVPGVNEGRGTGIIDTRDIPYLLSAVHLLRSSGDWSRADNAAFLSWCHAYLTWLRESKNGKEEWAADNNHGTFYDAQLVALALFVGDTALARTVLTTDTERRVGAHIKPDGSQPLELARTRPIHYSLFNLDAYTQLADMGSIVGVDLWNYEAPNGGSVRRALHFLAPYADSSVKWNTPDVTPVSPDVFAPPYWRAEAALADPTFDTVLTKLSRRHSDNPRVSMLYALTRQQPNRDEALFTRALANAEAKLERAATTLDTAKGYPRLVALSGNWEQRPKNQWTSGFFAGTLWYMYQATHDAKWRALAERWTAGLESNKTITGTHDLGFMIFDSFGRGYLLTGDSHYKQVILDASTSLVTRYNPKVGAIKSWDTERQTDRRHDWKYPVIVDNLMNLDLLFWSGNHGGKPEWAQMAEQHALTTARDMQRPDGSMAHVGLFDPATGQFERMTTWQGYSDSSAWARGQAWAIHGFTNAYGRTKNPVLLRAAQKVADYFIANLPADAVPYWDFRHPDIPNTERDASAAAIAASGLFDLARRTTGATADRYRTTAETILVSLATNYTAGPESAAILKHSVGGHPENIEVDVSLVYADYYFVEALLRRKGLFLE